MKIIKEEKENGVILRELTRRSASGEDGLFSRCWLPEGGARAVIQIAHGMNEHSLRYDHFARALVAALRSSVVFAAIIHCVFSTICARHFSLSFSDASVSGL